MSFKPIVVIVGGQGRGGLERLLLGNVADAAAGRAPCRVLVTGNVE